MITKLLFDELALVAAAYGGKHLGAKEVGQLNGCLTHPSGGGMDEDLVVGLNLAEILLPPKQASRVHC